MHNLVHYYFIKKIKTLIKIKMKQDNFNGILYIYLKDKPKPQGIFISLRI